MRLKDIYKNKDNQLQANCFLGKKPVISFEIFPPKAEGDELNDKINNLFDELKLLTVYNPAFISVTYGAGGSTQQKTLDLVLKVKNELGITPMPHFTCVGSTQDEIKHYVKLMEDNGIENILALRGDPPKGEAKFVKPEGGFGYANELVEFIKSQTNLSIGVAGYPETHQECTSPQADIENLKRKVDAGADLVITQIFYDNRYFFDFAERARNAGIEVPIVPGIIPITNLAQIERMTLLCGTKIPEAFINRLRKYEDSPESVRKLGIEFATYQCQELIDKDVPGLHFCILNKAQTAKEVIENLSVELV